MNSRRMIVMRKRILVGCLAVLGLFLLSGCIAGTNTAVDVPDIDGDLAGFWTGLWHGLISCVTFVISLFTDKVNIYEIHNTGNWYDFGFILGIAGVVIHLPARAKLSRWCANTVARRSLSAFSRIFCGRYCWKYPRTALKK